MARTGPTSRGKVRTPYAFAVSSTCVHRPPFDSTAKSVLVLARHTPLTQACTHPHAHSHTHTLSSSIAEEASISFRGFKTCGSCLVETSRLCLECVSSDCPPTMFREAVVVMWFFIKFT